MNYRLFFTCLIFLCLSVPSFSQSIDKKALKEKLQTKLDELFEANTTPGVTFAYSLPDGTTEAIAAGWADEDKKQPMKPMSRMLGGSTGKVFYSVVAMQLVEEGKIDLDAPVSNYLGKNDWYNKLPNAADLTVRRLMRHESGIPRYVFKESFLSEVTKDADRVWKPEELLSYVFGDEPLFEAGTSFAYSDTNYIVMAMVIEAVTGNDLFDEVEKRVLKKARLKYVTPQTKRKYKGLAQGYHGENEAFLPGNALNDKGESRYNWQFEWAGGGLVINTHDLAKLGRMIYEGKMFAPALLDEYFDAVEATGLRGKWGLGVNIVETPNRGTTYGHSGFMPGYFTNMLYFKDYGFSICFQINTSMRERAGMMRGLPGLAGLIIEELGK